MEPSSSVITKQLEPSTALLVPRKAVSADSQKEFVETVGTIEWSSQSPSQIKQAIDVALGLGCHAVAAELAATGRNRYPNDPALERIAHVLAPPELVRTGVPAVSGLSASVKWFEEHREQYSGKWLAVRNGKLLASADSRKELSKELDKLDTRSDVLVAFAR